MTGEDHLRALLLTTARRLIELGLNHGNAGNACVRHENNILITPAAPPVAEMREKDMVLLDGDGTVLKGGAPSAEWRIHCDILNARPEIGAVLHTHSPFATTLASMRRELPAVHYGVAIAGGDNVRCAPYALFGTPALSEGVLEALHGRRACLIANHGLIALGTDLEDALAVAQEIEFACALYWRALAAGGPHLLSPQQMHDAQEKLADFDKSDKG